jgi:hypothetical protein
MSAFRGHPEIVALARMVLVPASQLADYAAREERSRPGRFRVVPPGRRPSYCFVDLRSDSPALNGLPAGYDVCAPANASRVDVAVSREGDSLLLLVTDDGGGFDHAASASEHGLLAM